MLQTLLLLRKSLNKTDTPIFYLQCVLCFQRQPFRFLSERTEKLIVQFSVVLIKQCMEVPLTRRSAPFMDRIVVLSEGVIKLLKCLNPSKALGHDEVILEF